MVASRDERFEWRYWRAPQFIGNRANDIRRFGTRMWLGSSNTGHLLGGRFWGSMVFDLFKDRIKIDLVFGSVHLGQRPRISYFRLGKVQTRHHRGITLAYRVYFDIPWWFVIQFTFLFQRLHHWDFNLHPGNYTKSPNSTISSWWMSRNRRGRGPITPKPILSICDGRWPYSFPSAYRRVTRHYILG